MLRFLKPSALEERFQLGVAWYGTLYSQEC